jgi:ABC-type lipoprotein release transport system permease subunit
MVKGVAPGVEALASDLPAKRKLIKGKYLRSRAQMKYANLPADIYVGVDLAKTLNVEVGDRVVVTVSPKGKGRPASAAFIVSGIFGCGVNAIDAFYAEVPIDELQTLLGIGAALTQVAILLEDTEDTAAVTAQLKTKLGDAGQELEILPWQEALRELYEALVLDDNSMYMMMAIIFIIIALGIFNSVMMSVVERTREFGVMMALGTGGHKLLRLILLESLLLGLVAAFFGLVVGLLLHYWVASVGIDIGSMTGGDYQFAGVLMEGRIYSRLSVAIVSKWTAVVVGIVILSAFYPAWRASRLRPVEAMRHV